MNDNLQILIAFFKDNGWPIQLHDELDVVKFDYTGENDHWSCFARLKEGSNMLIIYSVLNMDIPQEKIIQVSEYLSRANFGLDIGNFEIDFSTGKIRFKTSINFSNEALTYALIDPLFKASFVNVDDHVIGIKDVKEGILSPEESFITALKRIEEDDSIFL